MSNKRVAESQLVKEDVENAEGDGGVGTHENNKSTWDRAPAEVLEKRRIVKASGAFSTSTNTSADTTNKDNKSSGFSAYAKVNPFEAIGKMGPPALRSSPKSPKPNPFSTPNPAHNPFMSYVSGKNNFWDKMASGVSVKDSGNTDASNAQDGDKTATTESATSSDTGKVDASGDTAKEEKDEEDSGEEEPQSVFGGEGCRSGASSPVLLAPSKVDNGEAGEECVLQLRVKLFRLTRRSDGSTDSGRSEWVEMGTGPVRILRPSKDSNTAGESNDTKMVARLVMRREGTPGGVGTKLLLNTLIDSHVTVAKQGEKATRLTCFTKKTPTPLPSSDSFSVDNDKAEKTENTENTENTEQEGELVPVSYLFKTKNIQETDDFIALLSEYISPPSSEATS